MLLGGGLPRAVKNLFVNDLERQLFSALQEDDPARILGGLVNNIKNISPQLLHEIQFWGAENGHAKVISLLIDASVTFDLQDARGNTVMHIAARNGHEDIIKLLLQKKPHLIRMRNNRSDMCA
jgi:ankyrin repeat protein